MYVNINTRHISSSSLAVSIKMNILLFAPGLLLVLLAERGVRRTIADLAVCALVQVLTESMSVSVSYFHAVS